MRVLWLSGNTFPEVGGIQTYVQQVSAALCRGVEVGIVTAPHQYPVNSEIQHFRCAGIRGSRDTLEWSRICSEMRAIIGAFEPDLVHYSNAGMAVFADCLPPFLPAVATVHGNDLTYPWQFTPGETRKSIVQGLNACARVLAVSRHTANLAVAWNVTAPIEVVVNGCDLAGFDRPPASRETILSRLGTPADVPIILTTGRHIPRKGHALLLEALSQVIEPFHWVVTGEGRTHSALREAIRAKAMEDRVSLVGWLTRLDLVATYHACDLFVFTPTEIARKETLDSEGFGLTYHEAAACGKPALATDVSGCRESVIDGVTGILVPPGDIGALSAATRLLLRDEGLRRRLGAAGRNHVNLLGGWQAVADRLLAIYEETLGDGGQRGEM
jgi:phosphatidyl-myo-inositol dimannoside synthase